MRSTTTLALIACMTPECIAWTLSPLTTAMGGGQSRRQRPCKIDMNDKQMSSEELVTFGEATKDWKLLMETALARIDKSRVMQGKPKYMTIEGMVDAYVEESAKAGLGWSRADAESEVVRYLKRQALADEGGERSPDSVFIGIFAIIVIYSAFTEFAPLQDLPAAVISPY